MWDHPYPGSFRPVPAQIFITQMVSSYQSTSEQHSQAKDLLAIMTTDASQLDIPFMIAQDIVELSKLL